MIKHEHEHYDYEFLFSDQNKQQQAKCTPRSVWFQLDRFDQWIARGRIEFSKSFKIQSNNNKQTERNETTQSQY